MTDITCHSCKASCEAGARFCESCGASLEPVSHCGSCNHTNPVSARFCSHCGDPQEGGNWRSEGTVTGTVVDGQWERLPEEFIRRVHPDDMRTFLGNRSLRVPVGCVGVVLVDGVVSELLSPGRRTTLNLFERIAGFFTGSSERTAFFLIDLRPVPVPFTVKTRPDAGGAEVKTQVLVSLALERGDREAIARFIDRVLGARTSFASGDLFTLLRPEITRVGRSAMERLSSAGDLDYAAVETKIQRELGARIPVEYGLGVSVRVAPLTTTVTVDLHLGQTPAAMATRACPSCAHTLPASLAFCDHCGHKQTPLPQISRLITGDGQDIEVDLVVRVQGQHEQIDADTLREPVSTAVSAYLRNVKWAEIVSADGFRGLESAAHDPLETALTARGLRLVLVTVIDIRSKGEDWVLGARADLSRAEREMLVGREWIAQHTQELEIQSLALELALSRQRMDRQHQLRERQLRLDEQFAQDRAELADRERRQEIDQSEADLDVADAARDAQRDVAVDQAHRGMARQVRAAERDDERAEQQHDQALERGAASHGADVERVEMELEAARVRQEIELGSQRARAMADDALQADRARRELEFDDAIRKAELEDTREDRAQERQIDKLRAMTDLEKGMMELEQEHQSRMRESLKGLGDREMIAIQATELAKTEGGGAAWAEALSGQAASDELRARLEDKDRSAQQMVDVMERAAQLAQGAANQEVYEKSMDAMSTVAASRASPGPAVPCGTCGAPLRAGARFCGGCGADT